jgi:hypothetical protein
MAEIALGSFIVAAAGWGILTWLLTGSFGLALLVFIVLKFMGR